MQSPSPPGDSPADPNETKQRNRLLLVLGSAVFLLFFQTFMVAPLIPSLADSLHTTRQAVGLLIPAYTLPYAAMALICGVLADRFGRRGILFFSLIAFPLLGIAMAVAPGLPTLIALRIVSGVTNVGIVVMGLSLIGDRFPAAERGRAVGWVFGAIAGGCSFGSTLGGVLSPYIGWRGLFGLIAVAGIFLVLGALPLWRSLGQRPAPEKQAVPSRPFAGYVALLRSRRGARTYSFIVLNGIFHSGVFTWLGALLQDRYHLGEAGIGLALLGYGVPGLLLGPIIGRLVDQYGRRRLIPLGMLIAAASALLLALPEPLIVAVVAITILSLGFDMSHPLFAGIALSLDGKRRGQAVGLNTFSLFLGLGIGSLAFGGLLSSGMSFTLIVFGALQAILGLLAFPVFRDE